MELVTTVSPDSHANHAILRAAERRETLLNLVSNSYDKFWFISAFLTDRKSTSLTLPRLP